MLAARVGRPGLLTFANSEERKMAHIDRAFVGMALVWLVLGMFLGLYIGVTHSSQFVPLHMTMLLPGFVLFAAYGAFYRLWPSMKETGLAKAQFWLSFLGVLGQVVGAYQAVQSGGADSMLVQASWLLSILGGMLMGWLFWKSGEAKSHASAHKHA